MQDRGRSEGIYKYLHPQRTRVKDVNGSNLTSLTRVRCGCSYL